MKLIWSPLAISRALEAKAYIAADNPRAAEKWASGLVRAVRKLKRHPKLGRVVPETGIEQYREIVYGSYRILYRISGSTISILTVRHSSGLPALRELIAETEMEAGPHSI